MKNSEIANLILSYYLNYEERKISATEVDLVALMRGEAVKSSYIERNINSTKLKGLLKFFN